MNNYKNARKTKTEFLAAFKHDKNLFPPTVSQATQINQYMRLTLKQCASITE